MQTATDNSDVPLHQLPRLFVANDLLEGETVALEEAQAHYLIRVMRRTVGEKLVMFNGHDGEWLARIAEVGKRDARVELLQRLRAQQAGPDIWLMFAPLKHGHMDFLVEKATELGAARLMPVLTRRSIVNRVNDEKMRKHAVEAAEQSERLDVPDIEALQPLEHYLANWPQERLLVFADEGGGTPIAALAGSIASAVPLALLIGPEGGFTQEERTRLHGLPQVKPAALGPRILRADTAALAALACLQAIWGDGAGVPELRSVAP
ncbi:16S rRNA (uracil(1498)-N(3))-methyltransferase [bacterium]|nr:16S rRNA (uracil(1498)-N(3))-methyltransferase [bacterium]